MSPIRQQPLKKAGFTLLEILVTMAIFAVLASIAALNLRSLNASLLNSTELTASALKNARAKAMATTSARWVRTSSDKKALELTRTDACDVPPATGTAWTAALNLPSDVTYNVSTGGWQVCFGSRGLAGGTASLPALTLAGPRGRSARVQVYLGGAVEVQP